MKDTTITARTKKRELIIFALCFLAAVLINAYSIITYGTHWSELYSMIGMTVAIAIFLYLVQGLIRLFVHGAIKLFYVFRK